MEDRKAQNEEIAVLYDKMMKLFDGKRYEIINMAVCYALVELTMGMASDDPGVHRKEDVIDDLRDNFTRILERFLDDHPDDRKIFKTVQ